MSENNTSCGFVAIVGRSNVGKSTLMNKLLGRKVSITSCKPQTTRQPIIGIHTDGPYQAIYVDTPGLRFEEKLAINRLLNRATGSSIYDVELVIFVVEGTHWTSDDKIVVQQLRQMNCLVVLAINKVDNVTDKRQLLPHIQFLSQQMSFYDIVPICAKNGMNIKILTAIIRTVLPHNVHYFPQDYITGSSQRYIAAEHIREKLMRFLGDELPYSVRVEIEHFAAKDCGVYDIHGIILVKRKSQKKIIIGNQGSKIKTIGIKARQYMEYIFDKQVHLKLWVKVKYRWADNEHARHRLEYTDT